MPSPSCGSRHQKLAPLEVVDYGRAANLLRRVRSLRAHDRSEAVEVRELLVEWFRDEPTVSIGLPLTLPGAGTRAHIAPPLTGE